MKKYLLLVLTFFVCNFSYTQVNIFEPKQGITDKAILPIAFINATIHVDKNNTIKDGIFIIKGNRVVKVGKDIAIPKNAIIYDIKDKHIYHSFIELFSSLNIIKEKAKAHSSSPQYKSTKKGPYHWNEAIRSEYNAFENISTNYSSFKPYLNKGFGLVLTHHPYGIHRGTGGLICLTKKPENIILADKAANFLSFNKGISRQAYPNSLMGSIALLRQFFIDNDWYKQNVLNQHPKVNLSYEANLQNETLPNIFILERKLDIFRAEKISREANLNFIYKGTGKEYENIEEIKTLNPKIIVPLNFPKPMDIDDPFNAFKISTNELSHWKHAPENLFHLEQNKIPYCITSDTLKGKSFFKQLHTAINNGASKENIYYALTELPAKWLGIDSICGTLQPGKIANFLITEKSIFDPKNRILENWVLGQKFTVNHSLANDVRGVYKFNTGIKEKTLTINGEKEKPKAFIIYNIISDSTSKKGDLILDENGRKIKVKKQKKVAANIRCQNQTIQLNFKDGDDYLILSGKVNYNSTSINGDGQDGMGNLFKWSAIKLKDSVTNKKDSITPKKLEIKYYKPREHIDFSMEKYPEKSNVIFKNATIWTADEKGTFKGDIWIKNGVIHDIGNNLSNITDENSVIIDLSGKHISPGIIDEHSHIAIQKGVNEGSNAVTSEVRIGDVINPEDINIYRQLAGGVTSTQLLHGSANPIGGQSAIIKMRWGKPAEEMKIKTAPGFIKFALGENVKQSNWGWRYSSRYPQTRMGIEQIYYDAFHNAKEYQAQIDLYNSLNKSQKKKLTPPKRDLQLESLSEIMNNKRFITCHSYVQSEINMLMHMADSMGFKINTFTHILEGYKVADKMKLHGAGASTFSDWWAYKYEVREAIPYNACLLSQMGIVTAVNSDDAEMGRRLNQEASKAIKYGSCSEEEAIKLVTINPATLLHINDRTGSLKVGKDADIVIWDNPPLSTYAKVEQTYVDGCLLFDAKQQAKLVKSNRAKRASLTNEMILAKKNGSPTRPIKLQKNKVHRCNDFEIE